MDRVEKVQYSLNHLNLDMFITATDFSENERINMMANVISLWSQIYRDRLSVSVHINKFNETLSKWRKGKLPPDHIDGVFDDINWYLDRLTEALDKIENIIDKM